MPDRIDERRRFRARVLGTFACQVGFAAMTFAAAVISARLLQPEGRGTLAVLVLVPILLLALLDLGQEFTGSHLAAKSPPDLALMHANLLILSACVIAPSLLASALSFALLLDVDAPTLVLAAAGAAAVSAGVYFRAVSGLALGRGQVRLYNVFRLVLALGSLGSVLAVWGFGLGGPEEFFLGWCAAQVAVALVVGALARIPLARPDRRVAEEQWRVGLPVHLTNVCQFLLLRADQLLLAGLAGAAAVGQYAVAANVVESVWYLPAAAGLLSIPYLSSALPESEKLAILAQALRMSLWFAALGALVLAACAPLVVPLVFGRAFGGAVEAIELLVPGVIAAGVARTCMAALIARRRLRMLLGIPASALAVNLTLNVLLIEPLGIAGAAIASSVSYALLGALSFWKATAIWNLSALDCLRPPSRIPHPLSEAV